MELARDQDRDDVDQVPGEIGVSGGNMTALVDWSLYHRQTDELSKPRADPLLATAILTH